MRDDRERMEVGSYAIEKISVVLSVLFIFLTVLHFLFSIVLWSLKSFVVGRDNEEEEMKYSPPEMSISNIT